MFQFVARRVRVRDTEHTFYVFPHPGAVAVVAVRDGHVALIRQYRPAVERMMLEIPAGVLEPGEDPAQAAARELEEETGLIAGKLERIGGLYATPGYSAEYLHVFLATDLTEGKTAFDPGEQIDELIWATPAELTEAVRRGQLEDAKTIAALFLLQTYAQSADKTLFGG
ncbi:MAG: NUDIX hydrolase [Firmicutes bacterium]|nr:NUDIX hydrolase [Bacillota bacterium]